MNEHTLLNLNRVIKIKKCGEISLGFFLDYEEDEVYLKEFNSIQERDATFEFFLSLNK